jgi:hypothetical protein
MRRALRQADIQVCVLCNRVINDLGARIFVRPGPDGKPKSAAGFQNSIYFGTGLFRLRDVEQTEVNQNSIKTGISKRQLLSIALEK